MTILACPSHTHARTRNTHNHQHIKTHKKTQNTLNNATQRATQLRRFNGEADQALVEEPDADVFVFCRVDRDCGQVADGPNGETAELSAGDVLNIRYAHIAHLVEGGQVHLI